MAYKPQSSQPPKKRRSHTGAIAVLLIIIALLIVGTAALIYMCLNITSAPSSSRDNSFLSAIFDRFSDSIRSQKDPQPGATTPPATTAPTETEPPETTLPEPEHVVSTATITSTGDILMHMPVVSTGLQSDGSYNFDSIFKYIKEYTIAADYAAANLETTLCGTDNGFKYSGYPHFNCPDEIVDGLSDAGFDLLLTANNHSYDTTLVGYKRTLEVVREKGLDTMGTYTSADETKWQIKDLNGIRVGMLCYTYANAIGAKGNPRLNLNAELPESGICNFFTYDNLDAFYTEVEGYLAEMKDAGAEATVVYMHWGEEYQLSPNQYQTAMAQKLCDMGVDVIIGGHPHVIQPVDLLTSTADPDHSTVVLYSMGNAVSNQRLGNISTINTAHTEDGILFNVTFSKYSDDTVYLESVSLIPCWVNLITSGTRQYNILPLVDSDRDSWQEKFSLSDNALSAAQRSYERTMSIVGEGLEKVTNHLQAQKEQREADYLAAVMALAA